MILKKPFFVEGHLYESDSRNLCNIHSDRI